VKLRPTALSPDNPEVETFLRPTPSQPLWRHLVRKRVNKAPLAY